MGERRGTKALELWCKRITDGYPGVSVQNMTTSWRDGLAFCAMIHHFRPDLIDFNSLSKDDIYRNNELAFRTAEQHLGIPALLDAEDMASCSVPDRLSILTYLSQFYQVFGGSSPSRLPLNRTAENPSERIGTVPESPQPKVSSRLGTRREPCASCGLPVFLAEKLVVARSAYHRSCFRCARCRHQLTPGNYYETEDGQYCCEACPMDDDECPVPSHREPPREQPPEEQPPEEQPPEEQAPVEQPREEQRRAEPALLEAPLSDEEKSRRQSLERLGGQPALLEAPLSDGEKPDDEFDQMIKLIAERIDELTTGEAASPVDDAHGGTRSATPEQLEAAAPGEHDKDRPLQPSPQAAPAGDYPEELNPFASDEEEAEQEGRTGRPSNPFGGGSSSDDSEPEEEPPRPQARSGRRLLEAPRISLNPFESEEEEEAAAEPPEEPPVPKPRTLRQPRSTLRRSSLHSSSTSIASACSTMSCSTMSGSHRRRKQPAPPPPGGQSCSPQFLNSPQSLNSSGLSSTSLSPRLAPRTRKCKPAPPPPIPQQPSPQQPSPQQPPWEDGKLSKDEANRTTQSLSGVDGSSYPDKSAEGKWKRKKGPAPGRPTPLRRKIKVMSMKDVKLELDQIEMQQQGLEKQGVRLEQIIRDKCESTTSCEDTSLGLDVEELVLELFSLVNEKNELFRRQAELMLLRRQQRLEEEHADIEFQVRCLISQPEATKTDFDKHREETLIQRLVEIVERRNEIVECLEMDRRREIEEDRSIHREMDLYAARNKADNVNITDESRRACKLKKGKVKEKTKEKKSRKCNKKDADKDVDETEAKLKRHSLRKWF